MKKYNICKICGNLKSFTISNRCRSCYMKQRNLEEGNPQKGKEPWNKGLTKDTDERVKKYGENGSKFKLKNKKSGWNKGLTKETDERVKKGSEKSSRGRKGYYYTLKFYIDKYGESEGTKKYESICRKKGHSLQACIDRYGEEIGYLEYEKNITNLKSYSKISQDLFWEIYKNLKDKSHIYFKELNIEFRKYINKKVYYYDFVDSSKKLIIEFNGDYWHANPEIYSENDKILFPGKQGLKEVKNIWEKDKRRYDDINNLGFKVLVIWQKEYLKDKHKCIDKCLNFLRGA